MFLIGNFGVELAKRPAIVEEYVMTEASNLTTKGYPFYVGSFELSNEFTYSEELSDKTLVLKIHGLKAALAVVYLNGQEAGKIFMSPFSLDVTRLVEKGKNSLKVEIEGTLRNAFGPLHYAGGDPVWIGPEHFEDGKKLD